MEENLLTTTPTTTHSIKSRRKNYWEPIYSDIDIELEDFDGNTKSVTGIVKRLCFTEKFDSINIITNFEFNTCDFYGEFNNKKLSFTNCKFVLCDLGRTTWKNIKFNNCTFDRSTITQCTFEDCQFIECIWKNVGLSGNETIFIRCQLDNPTELINSAYLNKNMDLPKAKAQPDNIKFHVMRLENSKHKLSKQIMKNLELIGDDKSYYAALELYLTQSITSKEAELLYKKGELTLYKPAYYKYLALILALKVERFILKSSGLMNNWGGSITRPVFIGFGLIIIFGVFYKLTNKVPSYSDGFITSFDITTLVGYTKHCTKKTPLTEDLSFLVNVFLGLWWYAVFVPTIINRISKVRL